MLFASIGIICWLTHAHTHKLHTPKHINKFHLHTHSSPTYTLTFSLTHTLSCTHTTSARGTQQCLAEFVSSVLIRTLFSMEYRCCCCCQRVLALFLFLLHFALFASLLLPVNLPPSCQRESENFGEKKIQLGNVFFFSFFFLTIILSRSCQILWL